MCNLYRGPSKDASYQVSVHLAKRFQREIFFRNWPIRNKNCLWRPCLSMDRNKMSSLYRGPSIYAFYQVSVHLAERFQRWRFLKIGQSETIIDYAYSGHVCEWIATKWAIVIEDLPRMPPTKFRFIWPSGFRGKYFVLVIHQSETRTAYGGHVCYRIETKWAIFIENLP